MQRPSNGHEVSLFAMSFPLIFLAFLALHSPDSEVPDKIHQAAFDSLRVSVAGSTDQTKHHLTILAVLSTECPLSRNHVLTLNRIVSSDRGVAVLGLVPRLGSHDSDLVILATFRAETGARFPVAGDPELIWVRRLGATVTPEVFLIDSGGNVAYSGAVDDWMVTLGRKRPAPTHHYLRDAITALRANQDVAARRVPAVGCLIE